jgi:hypothetical protein
MFLTQGYPNETGRRGTRRVSEGEVMTTAADLSDKIEEFLSLSRSLHLTLPEEQTLVSLEADEWLHWRTGRVAPATLASALLVRRLDYALELLRRMVETPSGTSWPGTGRPSHPT